MLGITNNKVVKHCNFCGRELEQKFFELCGKVRYIPSYNDCTCEAYKADLKRKEEEKLAEKKREAELLKQKKAMKAEAERIAQITKLFEDSGMSKRALISKFENYQPNMYNGEAVRSCLDFVKNFDNLPKKNGLFIAGPCGVGKSHLVYAIANSLIEQGKSVICMTMIDLLMKIRNSFKTEAQAEEQIIDLYKNCSLLIIDDLGKEKPTEWTLQMIYSIIDGRYTNMMPIIVTTNYTAGELVQKFKIGDDKATATAIVDRLLEMCQFIPLEGDSQRKIGVD